MPLGQRELKPWLRFRKRVFGWFLFLIIPLYLFHYISFARAVVLIGIGGTLLLFNREMEKIAHREEWVRKILFAGLITDFLAMTTAVYLTSGVQSPLIFFYFIELMAVHIYIGRPAAIFTAVIGYLGLLTIGIGEYAGYWPHIPFFVDGNDPGFYRSMKYLIGGSVGIILFFALVIYASEIALSWIRSKERELEKKTEEIQRVNKDLEESNTHLTELSRAMHRQNEELLQANKQLEILHQTGRSLTEIQDFDSLIHAIVREMARHFQFSDLAIFTFPKLEGKAELAYCTSPFSEESIQRVGPVIQRVARKKVMEVELIKWTPKGILSSSDAPLPRRQRITLPILSRHRCVAVMIGEKDAEGGILEEGQLNTLALISHYLGNSIGNAELYQEMEKLSMTDGLTSLYNHRYFHQRLEEEIRRTLRYKGVLSLLLSDLDFFKRVNDTYGHQQGDQVLAEMGEILRAVSRDIDIPIRYGGEEFSMILPQTDLAGAIHVGERLRRAVQERVFRGGRELRLTISVGIAHLSAEMEIDINELIRRADVALYHAKRTGRNRVQPYVVEPPEWVREEDRASTLVSEEEPYSS